MFQGSINGFWSAWKYELQHDKTNKMTCAPSKDSDQPGHPPSLIRVFAVHMKKPWVLSYPLSAQGRLWSDWDRSFCWFCHAAAHIMRKPVCARCKLQRCRSVGVCTLSDQYQCYLLCRKLIPVVVQNSKDLGSLWSWAGQYESFLVAQLKAGLSGSYFVQILLNVFQILKQFKFLIESRCMTFFHVLTSKTCKREHFKRKARPVHRRLKKGMQI